MAASSQLAYVDPSTNRAIIKVDNTSTVPYNQKRNTVRISTNDKFSVGSMVCVQSITRSELKLILFAVLRVAGMVCLLELQS